MSTQDALDTVPILRVEAVNPERRYPCACHMDRQAVVVLITGWLLGPDEGMGTAGPLPSETGLCAECAWRASTALTNAAARHVQRMRRAESPLS